MDDCPEPAPALEPPAGAAGLVSAEAALARAAESGEAAEAAKPQVAAAGEYLSAPRLNWLPPLMYPPPAARPFCLKRR